MTTFLSCFNVLILNEKQTYMSEREWIFNIKATTNSTQILW